MNNIKRFVSTRWRGLLALSLVACLLILLQFPDIAGRPLRAANLLSTSEPVTELYFTRPDDRPLSYTPGTPQRVAFTIHSLEAGRMDYTFKITQKDADGKTKSLYSGTVALLPNEVRQTEVTINPADMGVRAKITVEVEFVRNAAPQTHAISYWVEEAGRHE